MKIKNLLVFFYLLSAALPSSENRAQAAACCAGGSTAASIITEDELTRVSLGIESKRSTGRSIELGTASFSEQALNSEALSLNIVSAEFFETIQLGASTQVHKNQDDQILLGDSQLSAAVPLHRNYLYTPFSPEIFASATLNTPTGVSFYESAQKANSDSLWKIAFSIHAIKNLVFNHWDYSFLSSVEFSKNRFFESSQTLFDKGLRLSQIMEIGYSIPKTSIRVGVSQSYIYNFPNKVSQNSGTQESFSQIFFPTSLNLNYAFNESYASSLSYTDNRFFPSQNTNLSQGFSLSLRKRFF